MHLERKMNKLATIPTFFSWMESADSREELFKLLNKVNQKHPQKVLEFIKSIAIEDPEINSELASFKDVSNFRSVSSLEKSERPKDDIIVPNMADSGFPQEND